MFMFIGFFLPEFQRGREDGLFKNTLSFDDRFPHDAFSAFLARSEFGRGSGLAWFQCKKVALVVSY